jgi:hypothetical protein
MMFDEDFIGLMIGGFGFFLIAVSFLLADIALSGKLLLEGFLFLVAWLIWEMKNSL